MADDGFVDAEFSDLGDELASGVQEDGLAAVSDFSSEDPLDHHRPFARERRGGRGSRLGDVGPQMLVCVHDVVGRLRSLPPQVVNRFLEGAGVPCSGGPVARAGSAADWFFQCARGAASRIFYDVGARGVVDSSGACSGVENPTSLSQDAGQTLVNCALAVAVDGRGLSSYPEEVLRQTRLMRLQGLAHVGDKYLNREYARVVVVSGGEMITVRAMPLATCAATDVSSDDND